MPSFRDALKDYKKNSTPTAEAPVVPVNPPEAVNVLETQTEPETEGELEPAPLEVSKPKRAPRTSKPSSAQPTASIVTEAAECPVEPADVPLAIATSETADLVRELFVRGYGVTKL